MLLADDVVLLDAVCCLHPRLLSLDGGVTVASTVTVVVAIASVTVTVLETVEAYTVTVEVVV